MVARVINRARPHDHSRNLSWDSLLPVTEIDDYHFTPATTSAELANWATIMGNGVHIYDIRCVDSGCRIFIAHNKAGRPVATIQLANTDGTWKPIQVEGARRTKVPEDLILATAKLARLYQHKQSRNSTGPQSQWPATAKAVQHQSPCQPFPPSQT